MYRPPKLSNPRELREGARWLPRGQNWGNVPGKLALLYVRFGQATPSVAPQSSLPEPMEYRGRAALQRRVKCSKGNRPSAPVGVFRQGGPSFAHFAKSGIPQPHPSEDLASATPGNGTTSVVPQAPKRRNRVSQGLLAAIVGYPPWPDRGQKPTGWQAGPQAASRGQTNQPSFPPTPCPQLPAPCSRESCLPQSVLGLYFFQEADIRAGRRAADRTKPARPPISVSKRMDPIELPKRVSG